MLERAKSNIIFFIRKELIEKEEKNKDFWNDKFGFLLTSNKVCKTILNLMRFKVFSF